MSRVQPRACQRCLLIVRHVLAFRQLDVYSVTQLYMASPRRLWQVSLPLTLSELYAGVARDVAIQRKVPLLFRRTIPMMPEVDILLPMVVNF